MISVLTSTIADIDNSTLVRCPCDSLDALVEQYDDVLKEILDKHVPETTRLGPVVRKSTFCNGMLSLTYRQIA